MRFSCHCTFARVRTYMRAMTVQFGQYRVGQMPPICRLWALVLSRNANRF